MDAKTIEHNIDDADVIRPVIEGRRDAFQTLVARYADKVYTVAWCRLGDQDLAEEVVQETFIQAYQQLNCLRDPAKLLSWLTTIARNRSINLGIRFRNELKKRKRWAIDQAIQTDIQSTEDTPPAVTQETLQETLASLTATHRESLSLFYLQGKNVQEAAAASGVRVGTFKTRLHRARAAMRQQLETRLEKELSRLKSSEKSRSSIMAAVMTQAPGSGGFQWLAGSFLSNIPVFSWALLGIQMVAMIPGLLVARWLMKKDFANLKNPEGYHAKLHKETMRRGLWRAVFIVPLLFLVFQTLDRFMAIALLDLFGILFAFRFLTRLPVTKHIVTWPVFLLLLAELVYANGMVLFDWSSRPLMIINGFLFLTVAFFIRRHGTRMDHSVFLRLAHSTSEPTEIIEAAKVKLNPGHWNEFKGFLSYLASRQNVLSYDKNRLRYVLHLYPLNPGLGMIVSQYLPFRIPGGSCVRFDSHGGVTAHLGKTDERGLIAMGALSQSDSAIRHLESKVAAAMQAGYTAWLTEQKDVIQHDLGYEDDHKVYHLQPGSAAGTRTIAIGHTLAGLIFILLGIMGTWKESLGLPRQVAQMQPVAIASEDVNTFFELLGEEGAEANAARETLRAWFSIGVRFPSRESIESTHWLSISNQFYQHYSLDKVEARFALPSPNDPLFGLKYFSLGTELPWFEWIDTASLQSRDWEGLFKDLNPETYQINDFPFRNQAAGHLMVDPSKKYFHYALASYRSKMEQLSRLADLRFLDFTETIRTVADLQYLETGQNAGMYDAEHLSKIHGLFLNNGPGPIRTTWQALRLLEVIDGLSTIDREACIDGFKRLYRRRGVFYLRTNHPSIHVRGDAQTTYMAFDSLRILDALDSFGDLERWEFRIQPTRRQDPRNGGIKSFSWEKLEAHFMKREFDAFLANKGP